MKKIRIITISLFSLCALGSVYAGNISFFCQAGYVCNMKVNYLDSNKHGALETWNSGSFDMGQTAHFKNKPNQTVLSVNAELVAIGHFKVKDFTGLDPKVNYKGKMWGTIFSPQACLTENGAGCV